MALNGRVPTTQLRTVAPGTQLLGPTAQAFLRLVQVAHLDRITVAPVDSYGSGYRSLAVQQVFYRAAHGDHAAAAQANIDPNLHVNVATPGYSSHGTGTRIDMLFNGRSPDTTNLHLASRYGFSREFGASDENHFQHDGATAVSHYPGFDVNRLTGRFLNGLHIGRTTQAEQTGERDASLIWLIQHYGHMHNIYPKNCLEDGITGHYTELAFSAIWAEILKSA